LISLPRVDEDRAEAAAETNRRSRELPLGPVPEGKSSFVAVPILCCNDDEI